MARIHLPRRGSSSQRRANRFSDSRRRSRRTRTRWIDCTITRRKSTISSGCNDYGRQYSCYSLFAVVNLNIRWRRESDVQRLNDNKEYLTAFASKYRKMELLLESHEKTLAEVSECDVWVSCNVVTVLFL